MPTYPQLTQQYAFRPHATRVLTTITKVTHNVFIATAGRGVKDEERSFESLEAAKYWAEARSGCRQPCRCPEWSIV